MFTIENRLAQIHARIATACGTYGRNPSEITLLAVSKTVSSNCISQAFAAGQVAFGENYIQEALQKMQALSNEIEKKSLIWHCIGAIQSNKSKWVAQYFDWAHTIDSLKIAQRLSAQRDAVLAPLQVCLQVNIDKGANKSGIAPEQALDLALAVAKLPQLRLRGLMAIPEPSASFEAQKAVHLQTQQLHATIRAQLPCEVAAQFDTLSIGMSDDLEAAVAAGSTMLRIGTALFGQRDSTARTL